MLSEQEQLISDEIMLLAEELDSGMALKFAEIVKILLRTLKKVPDMRAVLVCIDPVQEYCATHCLNIDKYSVVAALDSVANSIAEELGMMDDDVPENRTLN